MIIAEHITKIYNGSQKVLDDVSLEIRKGDFLSVIGASGSGKSTLLSILGGIDRPTSGKVVMEGAEISALPQKELARLRRTRIGFVFQFFNLAPYLTVYENIMLPLILDGKRTAAYEKKTLQLMDYLGIAAQKDKLPSTLSGGEQQRAAIARGLIFDPEVIYLDEPTGNLDSRTGKETMELLARINKEMGTTIVQVTHSMDNAAYGNRIIEIADGRIVSKEQSETPSSVAQKEEIKHSGEVSES